MTAQRVHGTPVLYRTRIEHVRHEPVRNRFAYKSYSWFVDLDDLPRLPRVLRPLARFDARDHVGDPNRSIRANVDDYLAEHDIDLHGGSITMLASPRVLGHTFNPLSVFWCHDRAHDVVCVIAEVHNTYGERFRYLLHTDSRGAATTAKQFYVSPFNDVDGDYSMRLPEPDETLRLSIVLRREGRPPFVAVVHGRRRSATPWAVVRTVAEIPLAPMRVVVQIRWQGIKLWSRRLPIRPRPQAPPSDVGSIAHQRGTGSPGRVSR